MSGIGAFWSYSRHDDPAPLLALHQALEKEVSALVGWEFRIWRDRQDIATGTNWRSEIQEGLHQARILLAIITPRWIASPYCLDEYAIFLSAEKHQKGPPLVFPIHYIELPVPLPEPEAEHSQVFADLGTRQGCNWLPIREQLRAHGVEHPDVRAEITRLAREIRDIVVALPVLQPPRRAGTIMSALTLPKKGPKTRRRRLIPKGAPDRPDGPARVEISSGGNYLVTPETIEVKLATHFDTVQIETSKYRFPIALQRALIQVDALQADIDSDSCFQNAPDHDGTTVRYKRLGEWEVRGKSGSVLEGDCFPGTAACRLVNCRDGAGASARIVATPRDFVVSTDKVEEINRGIFGFLNPTKEKLIAIWLRERAAECLGGTRSEVVLHREDLRTELVESEDD